MARFRIGFALATSVLVVIAVAPSAASLHPASPTAEQRPLLGIVAKGGVTSLVRVDPRTLRPVRGRRIGLGPHLHSWALSPDRSRLAFSPHPGGVLYFADARTLRPRGQMVFSGDGLAAWLTPRRLLWVKASEVVVADPASRRHLRRMKIDGRVLGSVRARDRVALLVAPPEGIGPSRLLVVDAAGGTRAVDLDRISSGWSACAGYRPGMTIDSAQERAFVVDLAGLVAEVELATLAVAYHTLGRTVSPPAPAEVCQSRWRTARWVGQGLIAVSGFDRLEFTAADGTRHMRVEPAGLDLVDTRSWDVRTLDEGADSFRFIEGRLLATGTRWDSVPRTTTGMGLAAYALEGRKRFHLFEGKPAWISEAFAGRAYISFGRGATSVVDVLRGVVVGKRADPPPRLLLDDGVSLFGR